MADLDRLPYLRERLGGMAFPAPEERVPGPFIACCAVPLGRRRAAECKGQRENSWRAKQSGRERHRRHKQDEADDSSTRVRDSVDDVRVHDPKGTENAKARFSTLGYFGSAEKARRNADLIVLVTEWDEYCSIDPVSFRSVVKEPRPLDTRNAVDREYWTSAGWQMYSLGGRLNRRSRGGRAFAARTVRRMGFQGG